MEEESGHSEEKPKPPPPDIRKVPPPPSPPVASDPPPPPRPAESAPPLQIGPSSGSSGPDDSDDDVPGADASLANRVIAAVIDGAVAGGLILGLSIFLSLVPDFLSFATRPLSRLIFLAGVAYLLIRDSLPFLGGQSVGKKAMGIRAVTSDGTSLSGNWQPGVIRNVALLIPVFAFVELFVLISRQEKRPLLRLGDEWAKTKVINAGGEETDSDGELTGADRAESSSGGGEEG